jgi:hypothetical protein
MIKLENSVIAYKKIVFLRLFSETLLIVLLQYISICSFNFKESILWTTSGTAVAFIFLRGYSSLIGLSLGCLLGFLVQYGNTIETYKLTSIIIFQAMGIYYLTQHYIYPSIVFHTRTQYIKFIILLASISLLSTLLISTPLSFPQYFIANVNGVFIIGFCFNYLDAYFPDIAKLNLLNWPGILKTLFLALFIGLIVNLIPHTFPSFYMASTLFILTLTGIFFNINNKL